MNFKDFLISEDFHFTVPAMRPVKKASGPRISITIADAREAMNKLEPKAAQAAKLELRGYKPTDTLRIRDLDMIARDAGIDAEKLHKALGFK